MKVLFLTKYPENGASSRYCALQYIPYLERHGVEIKSYPLYSNELYARTLLPGVSPATIFYMGLAILRRIAVVLFARNYDLVFMHRDLLPLGPPVLEMILKRKGLPLVFSYDDALFIFKPNVRSKIIDLVKQPDKFLKIFRLSDCVIAANPWLRDKAAEHCDDARFLPAAEDLGRFTAKSYEDIKSSTAVVLGWIGSPSTEKYLELIRGPLEEIGKKFPDTVLRIVGGGNFESSTLKVEHRRWTLESEVSLLHSFDIGLMPLPYEEWSLGKSGGKARVYMAVGIPSVCANFGFNKQLLKHEKTGFLADSADAWVEHLSNLIAQPELRKSIGQSARQEIENNYSLESVGSRLLAIFRDIRDRADAKCR